VIPFRNPERREALFGGRGCVLVESLAGALCAPFSAAINCELDVAGRVGEHVQAEDDELVMVLGGEGLVFVNGASRAVHAGAVVAVTLGQRLAIENTGRVPLRYLIVKAARG
jgi:mannose-6-phosphate isomerase-like protein (cupin superfamily)